MDGTSSITTNYSLWFILVCIAVGALYAYLLYSAKAPWSKRVNYLLSFFRFALVTIICLLLLDWITNRTKNRVEKPVVIFALDNSESINLNGTEEQRLLTTKNLKKLRADLESDGKQVFVRSLSELLVEIDSIKNTHPETDLNSILSRSIDNFLNKNLAGIVLVSDGIYNQGISPEYVTYPSPVFTVGVGDTTRKRDIKIQSLGHNKIAYKGNLFPLKVEVKNQEFVGNKTKVQVLQNGKVLDSKEITFKRNYGLQEINFQLSSEKEGIQHYVVRVVPLDGEFTESNNISHAYIEILNSKEKVLCVALTPHPDIKALKSAVEMSSNIEFHTHITERGDKLNLQEEYDLIVFHQIPNKLNRGNDIIDQFEKKKKPMLFVIGNQSNLSELNKRNSSLRITQRRNQVDQIKPSFNNKFDLFSYEPDLQTKLSDYPPLEVPFGDYSLKGGAKVLLYQKVGSVETEKPALILNGEGERKEGIICGEGVWRWRLGEYQEHQSTDAFDQLIQKSVQLLSAKSDKRKFRVYTTRNEYNETEPVVFMTESYNEIYEPVYGNEVSIKLVNEKGKTKKYSYTPTEANPRYKINDLEEGLYSYTATSKFTGQVLSSSGAFVVKERKLEELNLVADHRMLEQLSKNTGGQFVYPSEISKLAEYLNHDNITSVIHSETTRDALINHKWIFFVLLALATLEWGLRKNQGGY